MNTGKPIYKAAAAADTVISTKPCILERIIFGVDVASAVVELSDSATDGDGNIVMKFTGSTLMTANGGSVEIGAHFSIGLTADVVNQTDITYIIRPST